MVKESDEVRGCKPGASHSQTNKPSGVPHRGGKEDVRNRVLLTLRQLQKQIVWADGNWLFASFYTWISLMKGAGTCVGIKRKRGQGAAPATVRGNKDQGREDLLMETEVV